MGECNNLLAFYSPQILSLPTQCGLHTSASTLLSSGPCTGRRTLKHRCTCGCGHPKLATYQRCIRRRIQISSRPRSRVKFGTLNTKMTFIINFKVILWVKDKERSTGYIVPKLRQLHTDRNDGLPTWSVYITMTFDLEFNLQGQIRGKNGELISFRHYVSTGTKMVSNYS